MPALLTVELPTPPAAELTGVALLSTNKAFIRQVLFQFKLFRQIVKNQRKNLIFSNYYKNAVAYKMERTNIIQYSAYDSIEILNN